MVRYRSLPNLPMVVLLHLLDVLEMLLDLSEVDDPLVVDSVVPLVYYADDH